MDHTKLWRIKLNDIIDGIPSTFNERYPGDFGYPYPCWCERCAGIMYVDTYVKTISPQTLEDPGEDALICRRCGAYAYDSEGPQMFKGKKRKRGELNNGKQLKKGSHRRNTRMVHGEWLSGKRD